MQSKLRAAELAANLGVEARIAAARQPHAILGVVEGRATGTRVFSPTAHAIPRSKTWIAGGALSLGGLVVNVEAERSIFAGSSLFASGVKRVSGSFVQGDVVDVLSPRGQLLARGRVRVSSDLLSLMRALRVDEIARLLVTILGTPLVDGRPSAHPAAAPDDVASPRVTAAFDQFRRLRLDTRRALLGEVLGLFPESTAALLRSGAGTDAESLEQHYATLVAGLAIIKNDHLATFEH